MGIQTIESNMIMRTLGQACVQQKASRDNHHLVMVASAGVKMTGRATVPVILNSLTKIGPKWSVKTVAE